MTRMWWSVAIEVTGGQAASVAEDELERFATALLPWSASVSGSPQEEGLPRYGARMSIEAEGPEAALAGALSTFRHAAEEAGLPAWPVAEANCVTEEELEHQLAQPAFPSLVGVSEIAGLLGRDGTPVSRQRASAITARRDFPEPVARLAAGPVWTRDSVRNFAETWERRPGRPARQENRVPWNFLAEAPPEAALIIGLAALMAIGVLILRRLNGHVTARLTDPVPVLPSDAPAEAARVLDLTQKLAARNQLLEVPDAIVAAVARRVAHLPRTG